MLGATAHSKWKRAYRSRSPTVDVIPPAALAARARAHGSATIVPPFVLAVADGESAGHDLAGEEEVRHPERLEDGSFVAGSKG